MKKLEQIQINKLISSYGGVGSIIETNTNGSLRILSYDQWGCFQPNQMQHNNMQIDDPRLLCYVKGQGYAQVKRLVPVPDRDLSKKVYYANVNDLPTTVASRFFPEWYFCPHCRKLYKLSEWKSLWDAKYPNDGKFDVNPPACPYCSTQPQNKIRPYPLQQIRFVMASLETGDMQDVAFDLLWNGSAENGVWRTAQIVNRARNLKYRTHKGGDGLNAIYIENSDTSKKIYLSEIARNYIVKNNHAYKMVVRGSQSLYFPEIVRSIYIPLGNDENFQADDTDAMDLHEFRYLTNDKNYEENMIVVFNNNLVVKRMTELCKTNLITRISAVERLKETSVLLSYSRMGKSGETQQWYNVQAGSVTKTKVGSKRPFEGNGNITFMPAVEAYGEGLFFEVDYGNIEESDYQIFIHTLCHIIMKEMEFHCGYPLTSLKEKIYVDADNQKGGFLIYTIAGSEGSYGGLISLTKNDKIVDLIERGAERARYCPNDPICKNESEAHCFACLDIPETSCVKFNNELNRNVFLNYWFRNSSPDIQTTKTSDEEAVMNVEQFSSTIGRPLGEIL